MTTRVITWDQEPSVRQAFDSQDFFFALAELNVLIEFCPEIRIEISAQYQWKRKAWGFFDVAAVKVTISSRIWGFFCAVI